MDQVIRILKQDKTWPIDANGTIFHSVSQPNQNPENDSVQITNPSIRINDSIKGILQDQYMA